MPAVTPALALSCSCRLRRLAALILLRITISHSEGLIVLRIGSISTLIVLHIARPPKSRLQVLEVRITGHLELTIRELGHRGRQAAAEIASEGL
ncbi:hypothetical protein V8E53_009353 [Lactarius tabidus]